MVLATAHTRALLTHFPTFALKTCAVIYPPFKGSVKASEQRLLDALYPTYNMQFSLTLAIRFTGFRIGQVLRKSSTGQCWLIEAECVKREQETASYRISFPHFSLCIFLYLIYKGKGEREDTSVPGKSILL